MGIERLEISRAHLIALVAFGLALGGCDKWERRAEVAAPREKGRSTLPIKLPITAGGVIDLTINQNHACLILDSGMIQCLGSNEFGQLGNGSEAPEEITPVEVGGVTRAVKVTSGVDFSCALTRKDKAGGGDTYLVPLCWGKNNQNQLGGELPPETADPSARLGLIPTTEPALPPSVRMRPGRPPKGKSWNALPVIGLRAIETFKGLTTEAMRGCVTSSSRELDCWGTFWERPAPGAVDEPTKYEKPEEYSKILGNDVTSLAFLRKDSCAINGGTLQCMRVDQSATDARPLEIAAGGGDHACMTTKPESSPRVRCFGENNFGQLGTGKAGAKSDGPASEVVGLPSDAKVIEIAVGLNHTLVLEANGKVYAWGSNSHGQIGNGNAGRAVVSATEVSLPLIAKHVRAGGNHSCAILEDQTAWCWGENAAGELGFSPTNVQPSPSKI
jgi:alpha-tubulin suppressor-like RCC1 family protein